MNNVVMSLGIVKSKKAKISKTRGGIEVETDRGKFWTPGYTLTHKDLTWLREELHRIVDETIDEYIENENL